MMTKLTAILLFFILYFQTILAQPDCVEKCYGYKPYINNSSPVTIEKKWESQMNVHVRCQSLVADVDNDKIPDIIVPKLNNPANEILILNSLNGTVKKTIRTPYFPINLMSSFLVADVDNDCQMEIIILSAGTTLNLPEHRKKIICLDLDGNIKWISDEVYSLTDGNMGTIAIADFNADGIPEVYVNNNIFNAQTGIKLADGGAFGRGRATTTYMPVAANIDEDPNLELIAGYTVYKVDLVNPNGMSGNTMTAINFGFKGIYIDGFTSIADINMDGTLDVIVSTSGYYNAGLNIDVGLYCYTIKNGQAELLARIGRYKAGVIWDSSGPAAVFFNKQYNRFDIFVVVDGGSNSEVVSFSYNGSQVFTKNWDLRVRDAAAWSGLTVFDLNADGRGEVIYRDEELLRIISYNNNIPLVTRMVTCIARTSAEFSVLADIDGTGQAKICIPCAQTRNTDTAKLMAFGSLPNQKWAPARKIWHQYAYNPLFINDNGTVPQYQKNHAMYKNGRYNNFMVQESLIDENGNIPVPAASLYGEINCVDFDINSNQYTFNFDIFNTNEASTLATINTPVSFYEGNPESGGRLLGTFWTTNVLTPGSSLNNQRFQINAPLTGPIWMVVNTDKNNPVLSDISQYKIDECNYTDNVFVIHNIPQLLTSSVEICQGDTYSFFGQNISNTGMYSFEEKSLSGCDSLIHIVSLNVTNTKYSESNTTACDQYSWNGNTYSNSGSYNYQTLSANGCDSIATLNLTVNHRSASANILSFCDQYNWNGTPYTSSGTYTYQTQNESGCDSTATLILTITNSYEDTSQITACDAYEWLGNTYDQSGVYTWIGQTIAGCDSVLNLALSIHNTLETEENISVCDSYIWNGNTYTNSGIYTFQTISYLGCDSIALLHLEVLRSSNREENINACDTYEWNGQMYTESGMYTHQTLAQNGCDSTTILNLTVSPSTTTNVDLEACEFYFWNGETYNSSGIYIYKTNNVFGCDSIGTLNLTIHPPTSSLQNASACDQYKWNGNSYSSSGIYTYDTQNQNGCDSTANLELTIYPSYDIPLRLSACESVEYLGTTYDVAGDYQVFLQSIFGCDSIIQLEVRIDSEKYEEIYTSCDSFYWLVNNQYFFQSGEFSEIFTNTKGCDSTYLMTLEINPSYEKTEEVITCDQFIWTHNSTTYTTSGQYEHRLLTTKGCDSIWVLQLDVEKHFEQRDTVNSFDFYQWSVDGQYYDRSGTYDVRYTSVNGCDSFYFLVLTIKDVADVLFPNIIRAENEAGKFRGYSQNRLIYLKRLSVYDRMASRMYHIENVSLNEENYGWDGRFAGNVVQSGVYAWIAEVLLPDGMIKVMAGDVTVVH